MRMQISFKQRKVQEDHYTLLSTKTLHIYPDIADTNLTNGFLKGKTVINIPCLPGQGNSKNNETKISFNTCK